MNKKIGVIGGGMPLFRDDVLLYKQSPFIPVETPKVMKPQKQIYGSKKCFRKGCNDIRTKGKLYCSAECCKLDKQQRKEATE